MKVEVLPNGKHVISDGDDVIELTQVSYEDIFYAIPIDNGSLFMLLNDTVLETAEARATLKRIVDRKGGNELAMNELQELVKEVQPGGAAPPPPPPEPEEEEEEEEEKTIVLPNLKMTPPAPIKPAAPTPKTPAPAKPVVPAHPTPARGVVPLAPTPSKGVAPITPTHPTPAKPVGPAKPTHPTPAQPGLPVKPAHPTPAAARPAASVPSALPPMAPLKKTEHPKPAATAPAEPAKTPAGGVPSIDLKSFGPNKKPILKVAKLSADQFAIAYGDMAVALTRAQYEKLHGMCPAPTSTLFHTLMSEVLSGTEKATFRKIVAQAGHSKPILDAVNEQVQKLHPGASVKKG